MLSTPLAGLAQYNQFILWQKVQKADGTTDKIPINWRTFDAGDPHTPDNWLTADQAFGIAGGLGEPYGVGFVFTEKDPFFFVDLDDCATSSGWNEFATEVYQRFPGAAAVVSTSQRGLHIIGQGIAPEGHRCKTKNLEVYTEGRFAALSPHEAVGDCLTSHTDALNWLLETYLPPKEAQGDGAWTTEPVQQWTGPIDDQELIAKAKAANSGAALFGNKATFTDLWTGDGDVLGKFYPDPQGMRPYDSSSADAALAAHLAFWTGKNCQRIRSLMMQSALVRDKWTERGDYLTRTILEMASHQNAVYDFRPMEQPRPMPSEPLQLGNPFRTEVERVSGYQFMTVEQQLLHFGGCAYVTAEHKLWTPQGQLLKPEQFKTLYGGYMFALDSTQEKTTTNAFQAFTESRALRHPKVAGTRFNPLVPPGNLIQDHDFSFINSYKPRMGDKIQGDVSIFLDHIRRLLPVAADQEILLSYLAACVQHVGRKAQWCVVLQGCEGNGKSALYTALEYAIGQEHSFQLNPSDAGNKFNGWLPGKLLVGIEELWMAGRAELANALKPLITNKRVAVQRKGQDQTTEDNFANFICFSNHTDAVMKIRDDRRYCVFYTAQQNLQDLFAYGMDDNYFGQLYGFLEGEGRTHVADYLSTRAINVNIFGRAPNTSSTEAVLENSLGVSEQLLKEAIELEEPGFCGGLICSRAATSVLREGRCACSPTEVGKNLKNLGYIRHPALIPKGGRVQIDGIRRRLYVLSGSPAARYIDIDELTAYWHKTNSGGFK